MKRLIILFCFGSVMAQGQLITNQPHLTISSFNDSWGGGFTEIHDDMRSFGFDVDYQFKAGKRVMETQLTYSAFTNRLAPDSSRIDELKLNVRYPVWVYREKLFVNVLAGAYAVGDLGGQAFQNFVHSTVEVGTIDLPYNTSNKMFGFFGGSVWWTEKLLTWNDDQFLNGEIQSAYEWAPNYSEHVMFAAGFSVSNAYSDKVSITVGANGQRMKLDDRARQNVTTIENNAYVDFALRLGVGNFGMRVNPDFSYGYLGISLLNWKDRKDLQTIDLTTEFGSLTDGNGFYLRFLWNKLTNNRENLQFDLHYQFWTLTTSKLATYPANHGHYQQFSLGANYYFIKPKPKFQILPYIDLRLGYKDERVYPGEQRQVSFEYNVWSVNTIGEVGARIKLPARVIHNNCYYGLTLNYQYVATLYQSNDYQLVSGYPFAQNMGYFGLGGFVMIDL